MKRHLAYRHEERLLRGEDWETVWRTQVMPDKLVSDFRLIFQTIAAIFD